MMFVSGGAGPEKGAEKPPLGFLRRWPSVWLLRPVKEDSSFLYLHHKASAPEVQGQVRFLAPGGL